MAFYEYQCSNCNTIAEHEFSIHQGPAPAVVCESCGKDAARKFFTFAAVFRGGGWGGSK
jgi:putative FmdB family regulatory protein